MSPTQPKSLNMEEGGSRGIQSYAALLALKTEEGGYKLRKVYKSWIRQGNEYPPPQLEPLEKGCSLVETLNLAH